MPVSLTNQKKLKSIDTTMKPILDKIGVKQSAYVSSKGEYFQGLKTHATVPKDEQDSKADRLSESPTDKSDTWNDFDTDGIADCPASIECHSYDGPGGKGYEITLEAQIGTKTFRKTVRHGPEAKVIDWDEITKDPTAP